MASKREHGEVSRMRVDLATRIVMHHPKTYRMAKRDRRAAVPSNVEEAARTGVIYSLMKQEPSVRATLKFYSKREKF
jgi:hypothetical protein